MRAAADGFCGLNMLATVARHVIVDNSPRTQPLTAGGGVVLQQVRQFSLVLGVDITGI
jgi:hypothetical protein